MLLSDSQTGPFSFQKDDQHLTRSSVDKCTLKNFLDPRKV